MQVILLPEVLEYLEDLAVLLYEKEYFSFEETASNYVLELYDDVVINLPAKSKKPAPKYFTKQYGKDLYYATFHKSKRTQWYVFFTTYQVDDEIYYQIRHIENNHTAAQYL